MTITIDDASTQNLDRLYEIERECFESEAFTKQQIAHLLTDYNSISLIAKVDDKIVGFIIAMMYIEREALVGHILTIDVSPPQRRKGIGLRLLQEVERMFKEKGVKLCYLEVREDNIVALELYQKLGYEQIGRLKRYYGNANGIYLRKVLA